MNTLCYSQEDDIAILLQNRNCFLSISNHKSGKHPKIHVPPMAQNTTPYSVNLKQMNVITFSSMWSWTIDLSFWEYRSFKIQGKLPGECKLSYRNLIFLVSFQTPLSITSEWVMSYLHYLNKGMSHLYLKPTNPSIPQYATEVRDDVDWGTHPNISGNTNTLLWRGSVSTSGGCAAPGFPDLLG